MEYPPNPTNGPYAAQDDARDAYADPLFQYAPPMRGQLALDTDDLPTHEPMCTAKVRRRHRTPIVGTWKNDA